MGRTGGALGALFRAVGSTDLKDEQKAKLEMIASDLREGEKAAQAGDGGMRSEMKEVQEGLVAGVKAGKVDTAKLEPHYAALEQSAKARQDREADALNQLHAALDPEQRKAAVASARSNEEKRASRMKMHDVKAVDGGRPDGGAHGGTGRMRFDRLTRGLELDPTQQKKVDALVSPEDKSAAMRDDAKKQMEAVLAAFETDTFDAKKLEGSGAKQIRAQMEEQAKSVNALLPILTVDQRERLARNLGRPMGEGGMRGHRGGNGMGGRDLEEEDDDDSR